MSIVHADLEIIDRALGGKTAAFEGATILLTGCAGFLGHHFVHYFAERAERFGIKRIIGLDTFMFDKPVWLETLATRHPDLISLQRFDIARDSLAAVAGAENATFVIHMASVASPTFYRLYPLETIDSNIWGLRHLLDFYQDSKALKGLLFFSSSEIYGDPDPAFIPTPETYRGNVSCVGPRACYDESKRFGETLCQIFAETKGMPITVARPFNNYGPGMRLGDKRLPADLASCVLEKRDIVLFSNGAPTRTFCYIADAVAGYLLCLLHGRFDAFNIGMEKPELTIRNLADLFQAAGGKLVGYRGQVRFETSEDPAYLAHNPQRRCPDIAKARSVLGYDPQVSVEEGVERYLQFLIETGAA